MNTPSNTIPHVSVNQLKTWLYACYKARIPTMVYGPPGIGKSEIHAQFADEIGHAMLEVRLSYFLPETMGPILYPNVATRSATALKPAIIDMIEKLHDETGKPVLVFLDEITTATSEVLKTALEFVLEGRIAGFKPRCPVHIVAAGNSPEDTPEAIYLPATHRTRLFSVMFKPTLADLARHIRQIHNHDLGNMVAAFLRTPEATRLMQSGPAADGIDPLPVPRSIVRAIRATETLIAAHTAKGSDTLSALKNDDNVEMVWRSAVGDAFWQRFLAHADLASRSVDAVKILANPRRVRVPTTQEDTVATLNQVADAIGAGNYDVKHVDAFLEYSDRCQPESVRLWAATAYSHDGLFRALSATVKGKRALRDWGKDLTADAAAARS